MLFGKSERALFCPTLNETQTLCCHFLHQTHSKESSVTTLLQVIHVSHSSSSSESTGKLVSFLLGYLAPQIFGMISIVSSEVAINKNPCRQSEPRGRALQQRQTFSTPTPVSHVIQSCMSSGLWACMHSGGSRGSPFCWWVVPLPQPEVKRTKKRRIKVIDIVIFLSRTHTIELSLTEPMWPFYIVSIWLLY